jgi:hypothetical protein
MKTRLEALLAVATFAMIGCGQSPAPHVATPVQRAPGATDVNVESLQPEALAPEVQPEALAHEARVPVGSVPQAEAPTGDGADDPCGDLDAASCYQEAWPLSQPESAEADRARAWPMIRSACERGSPMACGYYGLTLEHGKGMQRDEDRAFAYYARGCELGERQVSCLNGALMLFNRDGLSQDERGKVVRWLERACDAKEVVACYNLGIVMVAPEAAKPWFERACALGDQPSCERIAPTTRPATEPLGPPRSSSDDRPVPVVIPVPVEPGDLVDPAPVVEPR